MWWGYLSDERGWCREEDTMTIHEYIATTEYRQREHEMIRRNERHRIALDRREAQPPGSPTARHPFTRLFGRLSTWQRRATTPQPPEPHGSHASEVPQRVRATAAGRKLGHLPDVPALPQGRV